MKDKNKSKGADMEDRNIVELFFKKEISRQSERQTTSMEATVR
ncbi:hypothetical protein [Butyrivibrio fibrisolvens]|nr:hypothetical protein [Butyrivibrio fibrisolvens]